MIPYYIQKWSELQNNENSNRKSALCPLCGREELIGKDNELVKCSICCQVRAEDKPALKGKDIKELREKLNISLKSLCSDLKIDKSLFLKIEKGERPVNSTLTEWYKNQTSLNSQNAL